MGGNRWGVFFGISRKGARTPILGGRFWGSPQSGRGGRISPTWTAPKFRDFGLDQITLLEGNCHPCQDCPGIIAFGFWLFGSDFCRGAENRDFGKNGSWARISPESRFLGVPKTRIWPEKFSWVLHAKVHFQKVRTRPGPLYRVWSLTAVYRKIIFFGGQARAGKGHPFWDTRSGNLGTQNLGFPENRVFG